MKRKLKILLDIIMTFLFIILMGYHIVGEATHEIIGTITFILFIIHNILNIKWYKTILKGKHNLVRIFHITINLLLFISMIGMMISGIMISGSVFSFLNIKISMFGRDLHMISTSWGFVLMSIHVGIHLTTLLNKINKKLKDNTFEYVNYFIQVLIVIFGVYSFISQKLVSDMFLLSHFKLFNYEQSMFMFYLQFVEIILSVVIVINYLLILIKKGKK